MLLTVRGIRRGFGSLAAVDGVNLAVPAGGRHALIGPNGAGKTTLLRLLAGVLKPDHGRILLDDRDITHWSAVRRARAGIGRTHQRPAVLGSLTVWENMLVGGARGASIRGTGLREIWAGTLSGTDAGPLAERCWTVLEQLNLTGVAREPAGRLGHSQRRMLEIGMVLAAEPRLVLLDEPAAGLPPSDVARLVEVLAGLPPAVSVLFIEHRLDLVYSLADTITVLRAGRAVLSGSPGEIRGSNLAMSSYLTAV